MRLDLGESSVMSVDSPVLSKTCFLTYVLAVFSAGVCPELLFAVQPPGGSVKLHSLQEDFSHLCVH